MNTSFEDNFTAIQVDMVDICMEYSKSSADYIYIYCAYEGSLILAQFFFQVQGKLYQKNDINRAFTNSMNISIDTSKDVQRQALNIILTDLKKIKTLCSDNQKEMPTEIKIIFDVKNKKMSSSMKYTTNLNDDNGAYSEYDKWFNTVPIR